MKVIDASVAAKWFLAEAHRDLALALLNGSELMIAPAPINSKVSGQSSSLGAKTHSQLHVPAHTLLNGTDYLIRKFSFVPDFNRLRRTVAGCIKQDRVMMAVESAALPVGI